MENTKIYYGLIKSASPPVVKVLVKGFLGFSPKNVDLHLLFNNLKVEQEFRRIAERGCLASIEFESASEISSLVRGAAEPLLVLRVWEK